MEYWRSVGHDSSKMDERHARSICSAASFRQTYGTVQGFLKARATTKYIEADFANLTISDSDPTDLFLVATQADADVIGKMGFPWNMVHVFVLQNYSFAR